MKKAVKVSAIIALAKKEVEFYNTYIENGKYDAARTVRHRIEAYQTVIMVLAVADYVHFNEKWEEIYKQIWGE